MNYIVRELPAHYEKIIIRTFERGDLEDMALVMAYYGNDICSEVLVNANYLPERAMIFASHFLSINGEAFKANLVKQHHAL